VELKALFFKTLYHGVAAFDFNTFGFHIFLDYYYYYFFLLRCLSYIHHVYLGSISAFLNEFAITYQNKKIPSILV